MPRIGTLHVGMKAVLEGLNHEVVVPPPITDETVNLGARYAPEGACLPLKMNLGNYLQAAEGDEFEAVIMASGVGPCRFGYYHRLQRDILRDLGYDFRWVVASPPRGNLRGLIRDLADLRGGAGINAIVRALTLGWRKLAALDDIERESLRRRPTEARRGSTTRLLRRGIEMIDSAGTAREVADARERTLRRLRSVGASREEPVQVAVVGEVFMMLEPAANLHMEEELGRIGAEVQRTVYLTDWVRDNVIFDFLRMSRPEDDARKAAEPYLMHFVGGAGQETVGRTALLSDRVDGVIHVMPFTCLPEIMARSVMPALVRDRDVPVMTVVFDEHSAREGLTTRLEAFVDLLRRRRRMEGGSEGEQGKYL